MGGRERVKVMSQGGVRVRVRVGGVGGGVCRGGSETLQRVDGASEGSFSALTDRPPE